MNTNFLADLNDMDKGVQDGSISGFVSWPLEGECEVLSVGHEFKQGKPYFSVVLHGDKGKREFLIRIPQKSDKPAGQFMAMQKIYGTIYAIAECAIGKTSVDVAYETAKNNAGNRSLYKYTLSEYDSFSQTSGKTFRNQSLESLTLLVDDSDPMDFK